MNKWIGAALMAATLAVAPGAAAGQAGEQISERRAVDARAVKVRLGGAIDLRIKQGPVASLVLFGDRHHVAKASTSQDGDTLSIDTENRGLHVEHGKRQLRAELTLPRLEQFTSYGVGSSDLNGFSGEELSVSLGGAGAVTVAGSHKKITARLGGVGSMTVDALPSDQVDLDLRGAGQISVKGHARLLRAKLGGVGSLDAKGLRASTVELDMSGLGGATVFASSSADLKLSGLGSAKVYGKPARRNSTTRGLGSVSWE